MVGCAAPDSDRGSDEQHRSSFGDVSLTQAHKFSGRLVCNGGPVSPALRTSVC